MAYFLNLAIYMLKQSVNSPHKPPSFLVFVSQEHTFKLSYSGIVEKNIISGDFDGFCKILSVQNFLNSCFFYNKACPGYSEIGNILCKLLFVKLKHINLYLE